MKISAQASKICSQITGPNTKLGDLRAIAKELKKDHDLALELWSTGHFYARQLALLLLDKQQLSGPLIDQLIDDINQQEPVEKLQLTDWLMANQLAKNKKMIALIDTWQDSPSALKRRIFWYYQGRLRWTGQTPPDNTAELLTKIEHEISGEAPEVQWAMNFLAGWIGVYEKQYRNRCVTLGKRIGLYKGKKVSKGCTPEYLPEFIAIESNKRKL